MHVCKASSNSFRRAGRQSENAYPLLSMLEPQLRELHGALCVGDPEVCASIACIVSASAPAKHFPHRSSMPPSLQAALAAGLTMGLVSLEQRAYLKRCCPLLLRPDMWLPAPRPVELQIIEAACCRSPDVDCLVLSQCANCDSGGSARRLHDGEGRCTHVHAVDVSWSCRNVNLPSAEEKERLQKQKDAAKRILPLLKDSS